MAQLSQQFDRLSRPAAVICAIVGTLFCRDWRLLLLGWVTTLVLTWTVGIETAYKRFLFRIWLPLATALVAVWAGLVAAPPGGLVGSSRQEGFEYALLVAIRLAILSGLGQMILLGVPTSRLAETLIFYRFPHTLAIVAVSARTLVTELRVRLDQVWTARLARGVVPRRTPIQHLLHFPRTLRPLLAWTLRSAIQRSELWTERSLLANLNTDIDTYAPSRVRSGWYLALAILWMAASIVS